MRALSRRVPLEKTEQAAITKLLLTIGAAVYVIGTRRPHGDHQGTRQTPGLPDLLAFLPPDRNTMRECLAIECKRRGGRLSNAQKLFREHCLAANIGHVVGTCDDVIAWLKANRYLVS